MCAPKVLDGLEVRQEDRATARDAYLEEVLAFNARVDELDRAHEREMNAIAQRRRRVESHAEVLTQVATRRPRAPSFVSRKCFKKRAPSRHVSHLPVV